MQNVAVTVFRRIRSAIASGSLQALFYDQFPSSGTIQDESTTGDSRSQQAGRYYKPDATDDLIVVGATATELGIRESNGNVGAFSAVYTIKLITGTQQRALASYDAAGGFLIGVSGSGGWNFAVYEGAGTSNNTKIITDVAVVTGEWATVVVTCDGTQDLTGSKIYLNGIEQAVTVSDGGSGFAGGMNDYGASVFWWAGTASTWSDCEISRIEVYDKELTASEVAHRTTYGEIGTDPTLDNCTLFYKCDDTNATTAYDSSGNGNHGTKTNITAGTFHAESNEVPHSWQDEVGYSVGYKYDGVDDYHDTGFSDLPATGRLEVWVTVNALASANMLCGIQTANARCALSLNTGAIRAYIGDQTGVGGGTIAVGDVTKVAMVWDGAEVQNYKDDVAVGSAVAYTGDPSTTYNAYIGARNNEDTADNHCNNTIHRVRIADGSNVTLYDTDVDGFGTASSAPVEEPSPRDESDTDNDIVGNALTYEGRVDRDGAAVNSACLTFDGVDDYVELDSAVTATDWDSDFDFSFYVKTGSDVTTAQTVFKLGRFGAKITSGKLTVQNSDPTPTYVNIGFLVDVNTTYLVQGSWDGTAHEITATCYDEDSDSFIASTTGSNFASGDNSILGANTNSGPHLPFGGSLFDVKIVGVHHWPLAEGQGTTLFDAVGSNHGTLNNATLSTAWGTTQDEFHYNLEEGHSKLMVFDGSDDYVENINYNMLDGLGAASFHVQFMISEFGPTGTVAERMFTTSNGGTSSPDSFEFGVLRTGSKLALRQDTGNDGEAIGATTLVEGTIYDVVITFDGSQSLGSRVKMFLNGVEETLTTETFIATINNSLASQGLTIGGLSTRQFNGIISRVTFWETNLSDAQAIAITDGSSLPTSVEAASLNSAYENSGNAVADWTDISGNGWDATAVNGSPENIRLPANGSVDPLFGNTLLNPAGAWHNDAETQLNFNTEPDAVWTDKLFKGYAELDGISGSHIDISDIPDDMFATDFTIEVEVLQLDSDGYISSNGNLNLYVLNTGGVFRFGNTTGTNDFTESVGVWQFIHDTSQTGIAKWRATLDGVEQAAVATAGTYAAPITGITANWIGERTNGSSEWGGNLKNFKLYEDITQTSLIASYALTKHALDSSGNNYHGEIAGGVTFPRGTIESSPGGYASFDGVTDDYLDLPINTNGASSYKIEASFTANASALYRSIYQDRDGASDGVALWITNGDKLELNHNGTAATSTASYDDGATYRVTGEWDGANITLTVYDENGGLLETVSAAVATAVAVTTNGIIGVRSWDTSGNNFNGTLWGLEITVDGSVVGTYDLFADGSDSSGNANHATNNGVEFPVNDAAPVYSFGDGRVPPNYVTVDSAVKESKFYTQGY